MICIGSDYPIENYTDYKNRTMSKNIEKVKHQLSGIKQCSLKKEDKEKLKSQLLSLIEDFNF